MIQSQTLRKLAVAGIALMVASPAFGQFSDLPAPPGNGQGATLQDLMAGTTYPLSLKLSDLNGDWRRFRVKGQSEQLSTMMELMARSPSIGSIYYTRGQMVSVAGETFLIAYSIPHKPQDLSQMTRGYRERTPPPPLTPDTPLSLSLLNLRTSGSLTDIRPFDLAQEIKDSEPPPPAPVDLDKQSESNLKQLNIALLQYQQDYDETLPPMQSLPVVKGVLSPYVKLVSDSQTQTYEGGTPTPSNDIFLNPRTKTPYGLNMILSHKPLAAIKYPAIMVTFYEESPDPDGTRLVAFLDGHVTRIKETDWPRLKRASKIQ